MLGKRTGKFGGIMNAVGLALTVKATVWDKMTPEQKKRVAVAAQGAFGRAKDKGVNLVSLVKQKKDDITKK